MLEDSGQAFLCLDEDQSNSNDLSSQSQYYSLKYELKSSLAQLSENLSYFEREGKKMTAIKRQEIKERIIKTASTIIPKKSLGKELPRRLSKELSSKEIQKDIKLSTRIDKSSQIKPYIHNRFVSDISKKYTTEKGTKLSGRFFDNESSEQPYITIKKIKPSSNESKIKKLQVTRERSKRLLSINLLKQNKESIILKQENKSMELKSVEQQEQKQRKIMKEKQSRTFSKWSQSYTKGRKYKPISFSIDRRTSEQYESSIQRSIKILNRCHDILTTIDLKE